MILTIEQLIETVAGLKKMGKTIVTTNGVFDILHTGHIRYLFEAKKMGDVLIVGINSDASTRALKGETRPINTELDRSEVVHALQAVDHVVIFDELDPRALLEIIKPDFHVKGGDYIMDKIIEKDVVEAGGGTVILIDASPGYATTNIIRKIRGNQFDQ